MNATEFKAKCPAVMDRVHSRRESVTITKRGRALGHSLVTRVRAITRARLVRRWTADAAGLRG